MLVPILWLRDYTDVNIDIEEYCERMVMSGSNIETVEKFGVNTEKVFVGRIDKIKQHPNADRLVICDVNIGTENVQIVTGASNVFEGAFVPVAVDGSKIPGPLHGQSKDGDSVVIMKGELRGINSDGMLCGATELGLDDSVVPISHKNGIWILDGELIPGTPFVEAMELLQDAVDFEITPNRPDCLSIIGMARETAATVGGKLKYPPVDCKNEVEDVKEYIDVEVKNTALCKRYIARVVKDVKVEQSPWWLQKRLIMAGVRPINNIVDVTNYVMLEYGQPLHAFDIRQIAGDKIIVDTAAQDESFVTLDDKKRKLDDDMLMIKDAEKSIGIAGVMGGLNSEIVEDTNTIVIESANFSGDNIRETAKKLKLRTEAAARFEKGIDPNLAEAAADRVCHLIELLGAGTVIKGKIDVYPDIYKPREIDVRVSRVNKVLGIELSAEEMKELLENLEIGVEIKGDVLKIIPPTVRQDLIEEVDFIEEVARMYGYDKIPNRLAKGNAESGMTYTRKLRDICREALLSMGLNEVQTYSFVSPHDLDKTGLDDSNYSSFVKLINPLGEDTSVMRTTLMPMLLSVIARNLSRKVTDIKAFEIGNTFIPKAGDELPTETEKIAIGLYGEGMDFFYLKGIITALLEKLGVPEAKYLAGKLGVFHPGRNAHIFFDIDGRSERIGIIGEVHPKVAEKYGITGRVYMAELELTSMIKYADLVKAYEPLPRYPSITRDIALIVKEDCPVGELASTIREAGGELLESVKMFDIYRGTQLKDSEKSVAYALEYRAKNRTLTESEVEEVHEHVLEMLKKNHNAVPRES